MSTAEHYDHALRSLTAPGEAFAMQTQMSERGPMRTFVDIAGTVRDLVADAALHRGAREFLVQGKRRITYAEFAKATWGVGAALVDDFSLRAGDRVAVLGPNSIDWLVAMFGATSAGAIGVGLNHTWTTEEVLFALEDCGARFLIVDHAWATTLSETIANSGLPLEHVFVLGGDPPAGWHAADVLFVPADGAPSAVIRPEDPWVVLYSSGTSARPKGCITTHLGTVTQLKGLVLAGLVNKRITESSAEVTPSSPGKASPSNAASSSAASSGSPRRQAASLLTGPLFHVAGLHAAVGGSLVTGMKLVLTESTRFDAGEILRLLASERITHWGAVPTIVSRVVGHPDAADFDLSALESVSIGGAAVTGDLLDRVRAVVGATPRLGNGWGMTETHGGITMNAGKDLAEHAGSVGRVHAYLDLRVVDDDLNDVPVGVAGEMLVRGPTVFAGYWQRPEATAAALHDGWFRTGDIGFSDADGFVHLVDRASELIIRGGENISSVEIEDALSAHDDVLEVAVIGVPDADLGERVAAVVRVHPGATEDGDALRAFAQTRLARYKVPASVHFVHQPLPTNAAGKVLKRTLRALLIEGVIT